MRPTYSFSEAEVEAIAGERYRHPDPRVQERMEILWLKSKDEPHDRIAELAKATQQLGSRTIALQQQWHFQTIRLDALCQCCMDITHRAQRSTQYKSATI